MYFKKCYLTFPLFWTITIVDVIHLWTSQDTNMQLNKIIEGKTRAKYCSISKVWHGFWNFFEIWKWPKKFLWAVETSLSPHWITPHFQKLSNSLQLQYKCQYIWFAITPILIFATTYCGPFPKYCKFSLISEHCVITTPG